MTTPVSFTVDATLQEHLAGLLSQYPRRTISDSGLVPSSVIVPLFEREGELHLLFTKRQERLPHHGGQISFPGGMREDSDESLLATALRECYEEVGILPKDVQVLGELDQVATRLGFGITPFVGAIPYPYPFSVNREEVSLLLEVPVPILQDTHRSWVEWRWHQGRVTLDYCYRYNGHIVWGATARIVKQLLNNLEEIKGR